MIVSDARKLVCPLFDFLLQKVKFPPKPLGSAQEITDPATMTIFCMFFYINHLFDHFATSVITSKYLN